jgi:hypothetical protein
MLAKRLPTILPPLTLDEALETTRIQSAMALPDPGQALITRHGGKAEGRRKKEELGRRRRNTFQA